MVRQELGFCFLGLGLDFFMCFKFPFLFIYSLAVLDSYIEQLVIETNGS